MTKRTGQRGFGAIAAIMILVILGTLAAGIVRFGTVQGMGSAQDLSSAAAWQAARAGNEWGLYRALRAGQAWNSLAGCNANRTTPEVLTVDGLRVSVQCEASDYNEGEVLVAGTPLAQVTRRYVITATACSSTVSCPDAAAAVTPGYVERVRQVTAACSLIPATNNC